MAVSKYFEYVTFIIIIFQLLNLAHLQQTTYKIPTFILIDKVIAPRSSKSSCKLKTTSNANRVSMDAAVVAATLELVSIFSNYGFGKASVKHLGRGQLVNFSPCANGKPQTS